MNNNYSGLIIGVSYAALQYSCMHCVLIQLY